jgi:four helix bundle protein
MAVHAIAERGLTEPDEARMTNDEGMTKSKDRNARGDDSFWDDGAGLVREEPETKRVYDLEERTAGFGEAIIDFAKTIPLNPVTNRIITQLVGAGTSVGANYVEADDAVSKKEFLKNIGTCRKKANETKHFLRMVVRAVPELKTQARTLWLEAKFGETSKGSPAMQTSEAREAGCPRYSGFIILSSFDIRISSFSRV